MRHPQIRGGVTFKRLQRLGALTLVSALAISCSDAFPAAPTGSTSGAAEADLAFCAAETNRYRAMAGRAPVTRSNALEAHAALAAAADAASGRPHGYFADSNRGNGLVIGENEAFDSLSAPLTTLIQRG